MTTVAECWQLYLTQHLPGTVNANANARYWGRLQWFKDHEAERVSTSEVELYIQSRSPAMAGTVNRELGLLRACLRHAHRSGRIASAPFIQALPKPPPRLHCLNKAEAGRVVEEADRHGNWRERVYVRIALGTGARPGAIAGLTWSQVDKLVIDFRVEPTTVSHRMKRRSVVPINKMVRAALKIAAAHKNGDYVLHWHGRRLSSPRPMVAAIAKRLGMKNLSPHVLRHTVASILLQDGVDLLKVSRLLGHADTRITEQVYFQHPSKWLKETTELLDF